MIRVNQPVNARLLYLDPGLHNADTFLVCYFCTSVDVTPDVCS